LNRELAYSLSRTVRENAQKFASDLMPFLNLNNELQDALLTGLTEAWKNNQQIDLDKLMEYVQRLISKPDFRNRASQDEQEIRFVISKIADLILEGTNNDSHAFDANYLPSCEKILLELADFAPSIVNKSESDVFSSVLNSPLGSIYYAMVSYSLRFARLFRKDTETRWVDSIKTRFDYTLKSSRSVEFDVVLGTFLPQLYYLDKSWVQININLILQKDKEQSWSNVFSSYLQHSTALSKELYFLLRENQHYKLAIDKDNSVSSQALTKLTQHICLAYFNELESLANDSLINEVIMSDKTDCLSDLVLFVWRLRDKIDDKTKQKIKPLWGAIINQTKCSEEPKYHEILAHLSYWLSLVDTIDEEIFQWMKISNKYINDRTEIFYIQYLRERVAKTPNYVAEILYDLVSNHKFFPKFKQENIIFVVQQLFELQQIDKAKRICSLYLENGYEFLRGTYQKYNPL
jgi:hypothetical protein